MKIKKTQSAGGVVVSRTGEILVVSQGGISWSLPKGHIDEGENALSAAKREIYEESGIRIESLELIKDLGSYKRYKIGLDPEKDDISEIKTIFMFLFKTCEEKLAPNDPNHPEAVWIAKNEVAHKLTHPKDKEFFIGIANKI